MHLYKGTHVTLSTIHDDHTDRFFFWITHIHSMGGGWWWVVCKPILVFSLSLGQAEQYLFNLDNKRCVNCSAIGDTCKTFASVTLEELQKFYPPNSTTSDSKGPYEGFQQISKYYATINVWIR